MFLRRASQFFKNPSDVYGAVYPLHSLCTFFGLAPYSLIRMENGRRIFKFGWLSFFRNCILAVLLLGSLTYHVIFVLIPSKGIGLIKTLRYFQEVFSSLVSSCAIIFGCVFAAKVIEVFKNIDELDVSFRSLAVWVPYKNLYVKIIVHIVVLFLIVATLTVDGVLFATVYYESPVYSIVITFMTIILPYFINLLMELQYCHYLNILRIRYKLLNEYLETLVQESRSCKVIGGWTEEGDAELQGDSKENKTLSLSGSKVPKSVMAISDPVFVVDQAAALHIKLTDTAHVINYAFCVQQLLRITVTFVSIVTALFLLAINFSKSTTQTDGPKDTNAQLDYFFTFWAFSNACEVMTIVWITSETCEEANASPRILHKIRNNTTNTNLQETIELYSLQMHHNKLFFSVCGLFPLDYTLLYTIVAGVTTYLVILIQFNNQDFVKKNLTSTILTLRTVTEAV